MQAIPRWSTTGILSLMLSATLPMIAQETPGRIDTLSLEGATSMALQFNPALRTAQANIRAASAGVRQALSGYFPTIGASAGVTRNVGTSVINPSIPPSSRAYYNYSAGIQGQQTLFDFGRTIGHVSASHDFEAASESDYLSARGAVIVNVQVAYFGYLEARSVLTVNEEAVAQAAKHLSESKAFYSVGRVAQFDVTKAEVDLANAQVNVIHARNALQVAKVTLENAMGVHPDNIYIVSDTLAIGHLDMQLDSAKTLAGVQRPELLAARARVSANEALTSATWDQNLPVISASGAYTWSAFTFPLYSRWTAGVTFSLPIFQGFAVSAQVQQSEANTEAARADLDVLLESVRLEVEQAYLNTREAEQRISASAVLVQQAQENLVLAERQYAAGVGTALAVSDAQLSLSNARITKIQALYDFNTSLVSLQRAMGNIK